MLTEESLKQCCESFSPLTEHMKADKDFEERIDKVIHEYLAIVSKDPGLKFKPVELYELGKTNNLRDHEIFWVICAIAGTLSMAVEKRKNAKTLAECFAVMEDIQTRHKNDELFRKRIDTVIKVAMQMITLTNADQFTVYKYCKQVGLSDEEALWVYGVCSGVGAVNTITVELEKMKKKDNIV